MLPFGSIMIVLNRAEAIKEYISKEQEHTVRLLGPDFYPGLNLGFVQESGNVGLHHRGIYNEFFFYDRIQNLKNPMLKILDNKLESLIKENKLSRSNFVEVNIREFLTPIMLSWIANLTFGCEDESELEIDLTSPGCASLKDAEFDDFSFKGLKKASLTRLSQVFNANAIGADSDILNTFCFGLPASLQLTKKWKDHFSLKKVLDKKTIEFYNKKNAEYDFT